MLTTSQCPRYNNNMPTIPRKLSLCIQLRTVRWLSSFVTWKKKKNQKEKNPYRHKHLGLHNHRPRSRDQQPSYKHYAQEQQKNATITNRITWVEKGLCNYYACHEWFPPSVREIPRAMDIPTTKYRSRCCYTTSYSIDTRHCCPTTTNVTTTRNLRLRGSTITHIQPGTIPCDQWLAMPTTKNYSMWDCWYHWECPGECQALRFRRWMQRMPRFCFESGAWWRIASSSRLATTLSTMSMPWDVQSHTVAASQTIDCADLPVSDFVSRGALTIVFGCVSQAWAYVCFGLGHEHMPRLMWTHLWGALQHSVNVDQTSRGTLTATLRHERNTSPGLDGSPVVDCYA